MKRQFVESSMIKSMGYDAKSKMLEIEFLSTGQIWQYYEVPKELWQKFKAAGSLGRFWHQYIKDEYEEARVR
jgi:KTSC domain